MQQPPGTAKPILKEPHIMHVEAKKELSASLARPYSQLSCEHKWRKFSRAVAALVTHRFFVNSITLVIMVASGLVGVQTYPMQEPYRSALASLDSFILTIFSVEVVLKLMSYEFRFWRFFSSAWNVFDFSIVFASMVLSSNAATVLRMLRLLRVLKIVKAVPQLQIILQGLTSGMRSIFYILLLLLLIFYLFGIVAMVLFKDNDPLHFGNLFLTLMTLFRMATLEDWTDVMYINMFGCDKYGYDHVDDFSWTGTPICESKKASAQRGVASFFFVFFTVVSALVVLSLFIGVITNAMQEATEDVARRSREEERREKLARRAEMSQEEALAGAEDAINAWEGKDSAHQANEAEHGRSGARAMYARVSNKVYKMVETDEFKNVILFVIILAGLLVGVQTYDKAVVSFGGVCAKEGQCSGGWLDVADNIILVVFTIEILLKTIAEGEKPWEYFSESWNVFDFIIVVACYASLLFANFGNMMAVLRLLRLLRVLKLVKSLPQLQVIVSGLIKGLSSISFISILLLLVFYMYGIMAIILFRDNDPWHFPSLHFAILTLFRCATLEDWTDVMYINMYGCDNYGYDLWATMHADLCTKSQNNELVAAIFFLTFIVISSLVMLSLFIGVVTTSMQEAADKMKVEMVIAEKLDDIQEQHDIEDYQIVEWREAFQKFDVDGGGTIDSDELGIIMQVLGLDLTTEQLNDMMKKADASGDGDVDFAEFVEMLVERQANSKSESETPDQPDPPSVADTPGVRRKVGRNQVAPESQGCWQEGSRNASPHRALNGPNAVAAAALP